MHLPGMRTYTILHVREHKQLYQIFPIMAVAIMEKTIALNSREAHIEPHAVENFALEESENSGGNTTREFNGQTLDLTQAQAEAFDNGNIWIAGQRHHLYEHSDGTLPAMPMDRRQSSFK